MRNIRDPIFKKSLKKISWKKIYEREYGVGYSEVAVSLFATAPYHFPKSSVSQIIIPGSGHNTAFYIDEKSWIELVEGLNKKYTSDVKQLKAYEKQFLFDGENYIRTAKKISTKDLKKFTNKALLDLYQTYQEKLSHYTVFIWSAFILNNYITDKAAAILDSYILKHKRENDKQLMHDALFRPEKRAAILQLQYEIEKHNGKLSKKDFENLYQQYKWLSCLDLHNEPWTKEAFKEHIKSFTKSQSKKIVSFEKITKELHIAKNDLAYLLMAKRFVYTKDARDDYRRQGVFYALPFFRELAKRMQISSEEISYVHSSEILAFLSGKSSVTKHSLAERKKGFVMYLDIHRKLVCLQGNQIKKALQIFRFSTIRKEEKVLIGKVASRGAVSGKVVIVRGVKDLSKVQQGNILIAVTTHPDYVPAMRKALAIITDEGGITSHAAIVSREFGIPCIVGTKHATTLLKDGDIIKVNAIDGRIEKLQ